MSTHDSAKRTEARARGLKLAAKIATVGGIAVAALGLIEARAAASGASAATHAMVSDESKTLPLEGFKVNAGCGCTPCWGPPAPPAKSARRPRPARASSKRSARTRGAR